MQILDNEECIRKIETDFYRICITKLKGFVKNTVQTTIHRKGLDHKTLETRYLNDNKTYPIRERGILPTYHMKSQYIAYLFFYKRPGTPIFD